MPDVPAHSAHPVLNPSPRCGQSPAPEQPHANPHDAQPSAPKRTPYSNRRAGHGRCKRGFCRRAVPKKPAFLVAEATRHMVVHHACRVVGGNVVSRCQGAPIKRRRQWPCSCPRALMTRSRVRCAQLNHILCAVACGPVLRHRRCLPPKTAISYKPAGGCRYFRAIWAGTLAGTRLAEPKKPHDGHVPTRSLGWLGGVAEEPGASRLVKTSLGIAQKGE